MPTFLASVIVMIAIGYLALLVPGLWLTDATSICLDSKDQTPECFFWGKHVSIDWCLCVKCRLRDAVGYVISVVTDVSDDFGTGVYLPASHRRMRWRKVHRQYYDPLRIVAFPLG